MPLVRHWLGVPFAQQPTGNLRYQKPQSLPANASTGHVDASNFGPSCPQYEATTPSVYNKIIREYFIWGSSGDECLTVSIWAPLNPTNETLPVFIWIYGGGSTTGGSSVPYQNPQKWVQRTQSHIVVSLQYRLNFFGSPNGPGGLDSDLAFWDVRAAMEWTRDNIAAFGGDPARMVLWGQSAGARRVSQQSIAYLDDPIVTGYIQESSAALSVNSYTDTTHANWTFIADAVGCTSNDTEEVTECMQAVPQADVEALIQFRVDVGDKPAFDFEFLPDNEYTFANATAAYLAGHYNKAPKILAHNQVRACACACVLKTLKDKESSTHWLAIHSNNIPPTMETNELNPQNDGASLVALPPPPYDTPPNATLELASNQAMHCGMKAEAELRESLNLTTYRMLYVGNFTNISPYWWMGAYHSSELPLLMGTYGDFRGNGTDFERATSEAMQDFYLAFALDPEGGLEAKGWPRSTTGLIEVFGGQENGTDSAAFAGPKALAEDICVGYNS